MHVRLDGVHFPNVAAFPARLASSSLLPGLASPGMGIPISQELVTAVTLAEFARLCRDGRPRAPKSISAQETVSNFCVSQPAMSEVEGCLLWLYLSFITAKKNANLFAPQTVKFPDFHIFSAIDFPLISRDTPL